MTGAWVTADDGVRLYSRSDGPHDGRALLLLNSLGTDLGMWNKQIPRWTTTHRVLRFDQRGHGCSDAPDGPYTVERLGRDALAVLDAVRIDRADVCGISLGGLVALWLAANAGDRLGRLVLADTAARIGTEDAWRDRARTVRHDGMEAIIELVLTRFFSPAFLAQQPPLVDALRGALRQASTEGYAASCEALAVGDLTDLPIRVDVDTLLLVGTADEATPPEQARQLHERLPSSQLVELEGAGHLANLEQPDVFGELVHAHLRLNARTDRTTRDV